MIFVAYNDESDVIVTGSSALECLLYIEDHIDGHNIEIACIERELLNIS